jgi:hypothetical protein
MHAQEADAMKARSSRVAVVFGICLAVLGGCGDGGEPATPTPTPTATLRPTPTPVPKPQTLEEARRLATRLEIEQDEVKASLDRMVSDWPDSNSRPEWWDTKYFALYDEWSRLADEQISVARWALGERISGAVGYDDRILPTHLAGLEDGVVNLCGGKAPPSHLGGDEVAAENPPTQEELEWIRDALFDQWGVLTVVGCGQDVGLQFDWPDVYLNWDSGVDAGRAAGHHEQDSESGMVVDEITLWCQVELNPGFSGTSAGASVLGVLFGYCVGFPMPVNTQDSPSDAQRAMLYREYPGLAAGP